MAIRRFLLLPLALLGAVAARAETPAEFYAAHQLTMIVAFEPGSAYDVMARLVARGMRSHLPGMPTVVVQNMPGVASLRAANFLYTVAPRDGSVIGAVGRNIPSAPLLETANANYDAMRFNWLGSVSRTVMLTAAWHTAPVKSLEEAKRTELVVGSPAANSEAARLPLLFNETIGTRFKVITGYPEPQIALAMERGELAGQGTMSLDSLLAGKAEWLRDRKIIPLLQSGFARDPRLADVPLAIDHVRTPEDRLLMQLMFLPYDLARPFVAPPDVPADRVAALAQAFSDTVRDPDFLAEAGRARLDVIEPLSAAEMREVIRQIYAMPPAVIARARALFGGG